MPGRTTSAASKRWNECEKVALSYAVGEWARVWPLEHLFRSFGSYFVPPQLSGAALSRSTRADVEEEPRSSSTTATRSRTSGYNFSVVIDHSVVFCEESARPTR
jgi:hypothetical protein